MRFLFLVVCLLATHSASVQPRLPTDDRIRIAEAFGLADDVQDDVWPGWSRAPFALLLVTPEHEFLVRHPKPSEDFHLVGYDSLLGDSVYVRPRTYSPHLLATFPAVGGVPTIVIGQPQNTGLTSTFWVLTVLHEHFHQLQNNDLEYWQEVEALDLAGDDETGMWMLNFPFPYESVVVAELFGVYRDALREALKAAEEPMSVDGYPALETARRDLRKRLSDRDQRYLSFQLWQEGVARYVEMRTADLAASAREPSLSFQKLDDFVPYGRAADSLRARLQSELGTVDLADSKRIAFYPAGAAEAFLLDALQPNWKARYFEDMFHLERYYDPNPSDEP